MVQGGPKDPPYAPPNQERKRGRAEEHEELSGLEEEEEDAAAQAEGAAQDIMAPDEETALVCVFSLCWPKRSAASGAS